jgi:hypothetical protein
LLSATLLATLLLLARTAVLFPYGSCSTFDENR